MKSLPFQNPNEKRLHTKWPQCGSDNPVGEQNMKIDPQKKLSQTFRHISASLVLSEQLADVLACGRTYGCLGNAHYIKGDFATSIDYHFKVYGSRSGGESMTDCA